MAITETAAASSAAAEAADAAVHGPDLSMGTEHLTDAIADTTNYFVVFFEKLLEGLTWGKSTGAYARGILADGLMAIA